MFRDIQQAYLIELLTALGKEAEAFVLVGAQAMAFNVENPRYSKDFDFLLDVISLRNSSPFIGEVLQKLKYSPAPEAKNFQFIKEIPGSKELMRIEFLATDKEKRPKDPVRVNIEKGIHACQCLGAEIVLQQSDHTFIEGTLPDGNPAKVKIRYAKPNAVLMLKLLAMEDRYLSLKRPEKRAENQERARVHSADSIKVVHNNIRNTGFTELFWSQFGEEVALKQRIRGIIAEYFKGLNAPGIILYQEFLRSQETEVNEAAELDTALREINLLL
jgi:hypothetical protein